MQDLERISELLVCDFLTLENQGYNPPAAIRLFGAEQKIMALVAIGMRRRFAQRGRIDVIVDFVNATPNGSPKYYVDINHFLKVLDASALMSL